MFITFVAGTIINGGFNWGIDFAGGAKIIAKFNKDVSVQTIRAELHKSEIKAEVQQYGKEDLNEYVISTRLAPQVKMSEFAKSFMVKAKEVVEAVEVKSVIDSSKKKEFERLEDALTKSFNKKIEIISREEVGPSIGDYLKKSALYLLGMCVLLMSVYLAFRFEYRYSIGAILMILHDVILSFFFCGLMSIEINIPIVAGILTIFGYSVNDTIVVYDRIRENVQIVTKQDFIEIINKSITQTLSRTILTTVTTVMAVLCLYFIGEDVINDFALLLLFGFSTGIFSTIFVAAPALYYLERKRTA